MTIIDISREDIRKYWECRKRVFANTCRKEGRTTCEGCEFDLSIAKIEYIHSIRILNKIREGYKTHESSKTGKPL